MRLYRLGDEGAAVRDIQDRLSALDFDCSLDDRSIFGESTRTAVREFQKAKALDVDGIVGPDTWRSLYEAGYRLGDRILYYRRPMIRGEDVAEIQSRLNALGFDSGKVDGIFGPASERSVLDFQHNRYLAEDGKAGPAVVTEIHLVTRGDMREGRYAVREREWLRSLPTTVAGSRVYLDASDRDPEEATACWAAASAAALRLQELGGLPVLSRSQDTSLPERVRARRANRFGSDLIVAFQVNDEEDCVFYFGSPHSRSAAGEMLAGLVAATVGGKVEPRASAMLKETRAPAIVVSRPRITPDVGAASIDGLVEFFASAASRSISR
ncbi:MAG: peptidoglycan-binding protein [Acidimicrobiia bacterium]